MNNLESPNASFDPSENPWTSEFSDDPWTEPTNSPESPELLSLPDDPAISFWRNINNPILNNYNAAINTSHSPEEIAKILDSNTARSILPYLSKSSL